MSSREGYQRGFEGKASEIEQYVDDHLAFDQVAENAYEAENLGIEFDYTEGEETARIRADGKRPVDNFIREIDRRLNSSKGAEDKSLFFNGVEESAPPISEDSAYQERARAVADGGEHGEEKGTEWSHTPKNSDLDVQGVFVRGMYQSGIER